MNSLRLSDIAIAIDGKLVGEDSIADFVFTDSRKAKGSVNKGKGLFIALKGDKFDGHDFIKQLGEGSVAGVIVETPQSIDFAQIIVKDTRIALGDLAKLNRSLCNAKFIAVTGSSGKTTVKEMIASILSECGNTCATLGNLNNDIGAPLTLLEIDKSADYAVIELGANHAGEIAYTSAITKPHVALVNNVSAAHIEGFGSLEGVASAKSEIYASLDRDGTAILNIDDKFSSFFRTKILSNIITYSVINEADVFATDIYLNDDQSTRFNLNFHAGQVEVTLPLVGQHNVANALAAASCCIALGVSLEKVAKGLEKTPSVSGRLDINKLENGCVVIDDSYNANLGSVKAAIDLLSNYQTKQILVLGDMAELGDLSKKYHQEIGVYAQAKGIDRLFTIGTDSKNSQVAYSKENSNNKFDHTKLSDHFYNKNELIIKLIKEAIDGVTILVKGSRSSRMEEIVEALTKSKVKVLGEQMVGDRASLVGEQ